MTTLKINGEKPQFNNIILHAVKCTLYLNTCQVISKTVIIIIIFNIETFRVICRLNSVIGQIIAWCTNQNSTVFSLN